tara:strand:- start:509 stop:736 length:228 start_codon:yes stop_codon:yes gene_type:complete|eukprot:scaffold31098_cov75-Phaeocystis_antarctica.AAC.3
MEGCLHERVSTEAVGQVDGRASLQQLGHDLQVAAGCGRTQQAEVGVGWSTAERVDRPSLAQPLDYRMQLAKLGRP